MGGWVGEGMNGWIRCFNIFSLLGAVSLFSIHCSTFSVFLMHF